MMRKQVPTSYQEERDKQKSVFIKYLAIKARSNFGNPNY